MKFDALPRTEVTVETRAISPRSLRRLDRHTTVKVADDSGIELASGGFAWASGEANKTGVQVGSVAWGESNVLIFGCAAGSLIEFALTDPGGRGVVTELSGGLVEIHLAALVQSDAQIDRLHYETRYSDRPTERSYARTPPRQWAAGVGGNFGWVPAPDPRRAP